MKITSGPWTVRGSHYSLPQVWTADEQQCITDRVFNDDNARLIAAAPELLEACKALLAVVDSLPNGHSAERVTAALAAKSAITKAIGQK